jgi:hypothetical protein
MRTLNAIVVAFTLVLAAWTFGYEAALFLRTPAWTSVLFAAPFAIGFFWVCRGRKGKTGREIGSEVAMLVGIAVLSVAAVLCICQPSYDDFSFFQRAEWQASRLSEPFRMTATTTYWEGGELPALSPLHVMTSHEPGCMMLGKALGIDPLQVYFNLWPAFMAVVAVFALALLGRELGLRASSRVLFCAGALLAYFLDGSCFRGFSGYALLRLSQGKCALVLCGIPLLLLFALRFWKWPSKSNWLLLFAVSVAFVGWTGSGIALAPIGLAALAISLWAVAGRRGRLVGRAFALVASGVVPICITALVMTKVIKMPPDSSVWDWGWANDWFKNLLLIVPGWPQLARNFAVAILAPCWVVPRSKGYWLAVFPLALIVLCFNPLTGPSVLNMMHPGTYWRLAFFVFIPVGIGLLLAGIGQAGSPARQWISGVALAISLFLGYPFLIPPSGQITYKSPGDLRFEPEALNVARAVDGLAPGKRVLCPDNVGVALGMIDPEMRLLTTQSGELRHLFANAGALDEGQARWRAYGFLVAGYPPGRGDFVNLVQSLADVIVSPKTSERWLPAAIRDAGVRCQVGQMGNYDVYLIQRP